MSRYGVSEIVRTVWGTGAFAGQSVVAVRFTGCNLWDGHYLHRDEGAAPCALWCDAAFNKGIPLSVEDVVGMAQEQWPIEPGSAVRWCVLTGGEPALQIDAALVLALQEAGWLVVVETNGTVPNDALRLCNHVCLSPQRGTPYMESGAAGAPDSVVVVLPGAPPMIKGWTNEQLDQLERDVDAQQTGAMFFVQPQDPVLPGEELASYLLGGYDQEQEGVGPMLQELWGAAVLACVCQVYRRSHWRVSVQAHKLLGLP